MAVDPTAGATGGPGGWGLGALGAPSVSTTPIQPRGMTLTPEQIAQLRKQSTELQQPPKQNIQHWTQGLAELVRAIQGNREADFARQQELQGRQQGAEATAQMYSPFLSPGAQPTPPGAGAAPGGTQGTVPTGASAPQGAPPTTVASAGGSGDDPRGLEPYIRETATKYGVDPEIAMKVARSEGLRTFLGDNGKSGGAFQLYTGGGMGNDFQKETGLNPLDPANERATIDYALKNVPKVGWTPFHGARRVGIGPRDGILQPPQDASAPPTTAATAPAAAPTPRGLLAPIPAAVTAPAPTPPPAPAPAAANPPPPRAAADPRTRLAYAGDTIPPGMVPNAATQGAVPSSLSPIVNAIAGRPTPLPTNPTAPPPPPVAPAPQPGDVPDFAKQAAILAARGQQPAVPLAPADITARAGELAADRGPSVPMSPEQVAAMGLPIQVPPAARSVPITPPPAPAPATPDAGAPPTGPVPVPTPRPDLPLPRGSAIPGAVGPTSVGGTVLAPPISAPPRPYAPPAAPGAAPTLVNAIAGRDVPPAGPGAPPAPAPIRVAQNGPPTAAVPTAAGGPPGLPSPLTSATGQMTQEQLTRVLANPWVPEQAKAAMLQMIQQRGQPQVMDVEGGKLMYNAAGQKVFIPEPRFGTVEIGSAKIPTVSHYDPAAGRWNTTTLAPGGGVQTQPGGGAPGAHPAQAQGGITEPDLSTIGGIQAAEAAQAGAKKGAEEAASSRAKTFNTIKTGITGDAFNASRQEPIIDAMARIAPAAITGAGSDVALEINRIAAQLGINPQGAAPRELFNQLSAKLLGDQFANIRNMSTEEGSPGGKIFKSMLDLEEKANITPTDSLEGVQAKLGFMKKAGQMLQRWGDMADDYAATHGGQLDEGFMKGLRHDLAAQNYDDILPKADATSPTGTRTAPSFEEVQAELRRRNKLPPAGPAAAPVSR